MTYSCLRFKKVHNEPGLSKIVQKAKYDWLRMPDMCNLLGVLETQFLGSRLPYKEHKYVPRGRNVNVFSSYGVGLSAKLYCARVFTYMCLKTAQSANR